MELATLALNYIVGIAIGLLIGIAFPMGIRKKPVEVQLKPSGIQVKEKGAVIQPPTPAEEARKKILDKHDKYNEGVPLEKII